MIKAIHALASRLRHSPPFSLGEPLFRRIEPRWNRLMSRMSGRSGFPTRVNGDVFRLTYEYGSRYDKSESYEPDIYVPFVADIKAGMTVLDVGAHVGFFTLAAAARVGAAGLVMAFEPSPDTVEVLREHVAMNAYGARVIVHDAVASDTNGSMTFFTYGASMAASISRDNVEVLNVQRPEHATPVTVRSLTLDDACREAHVVPDIIKIDVEGAELRVLRGAEPILRGRAPVIYCEIHPMQLENCGGSVKELEEFLAAVRYEIEPLAPPGHMGIYPSRLRPMAEASG